MSSQGAASITSSVQPSQMLMQGGLQSSQQQFLSQNPYGGFGVTSGGATGAYGQFSDMSIY